MWRFTAEGNERMAQSTAIRTRQELLAAERKLYAPDQAHKVTVREEFVDGGAKIELTPLFDGQPGKTKPVVVVVTV